MSETYAGCRRATFVRRATARRMSVVAMCLAAVSALADITFDLTYIGNPGNGADDTGHGSVGYSYSIGTYEVTVSQYVEFLNAKAQSDPYGLYNASMSTGPLGAFINRSGSDDDYSYTAVSGKEDEPVRYVSFFDGLRLCNWLSNGQGSGDTESGSYDMSLGLFVDREPGATWVLPTEDEWYKAAYYDPASGIYYDYPNGTDDVPAEPGDETSPRAMNFGDDPFWQGGVYFTSTGETTGQSPYGTYDQGGNVREWLETRSVQFPNHLVRGGSFLSHTNDLSSGRSYGYDPDSEGFFGFRVAFVVPEPSTVLLGLLGALLLSIRGKRSS